MGTSIDAETKSFSRKKRFLEEENFSPLMRQNIVYLIPYLLEDVTDIHINRPKELFLKYANGTRKKIIDDKLTEKWLSGMAYFLACTTGQKYNSSHPIVGFKLPGGHRVQVVAGTSVESNFSCAIRVNRGYQYSLDDFGLSKKDKTHLIEAIKTRKTLLVSGGTGTGKTSLINALIQSIDPEDRIISVEDVRELAIPHENHSALSYSANQTDVAGIQPSDLLAAVLRLDPDRILIGEIRQQNATTFFRAINTGHEGSMATIHANNPEEALHAVCDYMVMSGEVADGAFETTIRRLRQNIYGVVQLTYHPGKARKAQFEVF